MNKIAIVTGSTGEIGSEILKKLLEENYTVYAIGRNFQSDCFKKIYETLEDKSRIKTIYYDFINVENIPNMVKNIYEKEKRIDLLVCCHGISLNSLAIDTTIEETFKIITINQTSVIIMCNEVLKYMLKTDMEKNIINISSIWANRAASCESIYAATKAAVEMYSKSIAVEYIKSNIRVNTIAPGYIDTKMNKFSKEDKEEIISEIPIGRFGDAKDIANTVKYIIDTKYLVGENICLNGGWLI